MNGFQMITVQPRLQLLKSPEPGDVTLDLSCSARGDAHDDAIQVPPL